MQIGELTVDKDIVSWSFSNKPVSIKINHLKDACLYAKGKTVLALAGEGNYPSTLLGYNVDGTPKFEVTAPAGYIFSYITEHPEVGVAVVCGGNEKVDGWYDWHFAIDTKTGKLTRHCPAY
jgi:hypothetical protein